MGAVRGLLFISFNNINNGSQGGRLCGIIINFNKLFAGHMLSVVRHNNIILTTVLQVTCSPLCTASSSSTSTSRSSFRRGAPRNQSSSARQAQILTPPPLFFTMACKQNPDLRCVFGPAPWVLGPKHVRFQNKEVYATLQCSPTFVAGNLFLVPGAPTNHTATKLIIICAWLATLCSQGIKSIVICAWLATLCSQAIKLIIICASVATLRFQASARRTRTRRLLRRSRTRACR